MSMEDYTPDLEFDDEAPPAKRHKFQSYQKSLQGVHLTSSLKQTTLGQDIGDSQSYFREALDRWREQNLSPAFIKFARVADGLSLSLPLLLHNWEKVFEAWDGAIATADDEGMKPLLDLLQKLTHDLRSVLAPRYEDLVSRLFALLPRSLSAATFTIFLETCSSLFKYLLVPSTDDVLVISTWKQLHKNLPEANPEVQRAVAEVWGSVLRRLKAVPRASGLLLLSESLDGVEDAAAWALVLACKSVSHTVHTSSVAVLSPVLDYHLSCDNPELSFKLLRRVLTALMHHCKSSVEFLPIATMIVHKTKTAIEADVADAEQIRRIMEVSSTICAVRQGSRLTQDHVSSLLTLYTQVEYQATSHTTLLRSTVAVLQASQLQLWSGVGRRLIEHAWKSSAKLGIETLGCLAEMDWKGWSMIGAPLLLRHTPDGLEQQLNLMVHLLSRLYKAKKLGEVDHVWKQRMDKWVGLELTGWQRSEDKILRLRDLVALLPLLSPVEPLLVNIVSDALECQDVDADVNASYANSAIILSSCLEALARSKSSSWLAAVDLVSWTRNAMEKWGDNAHVLQAYVSLLEAPHCRNLQLSVETLYPHLRTSLLSHQQILRALVLRLLSSKAFQKSSAMDTIKVCLQAEDVSLDVQGVRERVLRITRVGETVKNDDSTSADICSVWLTAQLKVNLRPLWSPAASALFQLSRSHEKVVWPMVFEELRSVATGSISLSVPHWISLAADEEEQDGIFEEERTWRDPKAHGLLVTTGSWKDEDVRIKEAILVQKTAERLDLGSYETQLLLTMGVFHSLAEKHGRELVPLFLSLAEPEGGNPLPRRKLSGWLELFAKFSNPKALYSADRLLALHTSLLSHADKALQSTALSCLMTYRPPHVHPHEDTLRALLDDTRWRDALAKLDLSALPAQDRSEIVPVIVRLLYGVMLARQGRGRGADRRSAILGLFGQCTSMELKLLADLMLKSFSDPIDSEQGSWTPSPIPSNVTAKQQTGFLHLLEDVLHNLGPSLVAEWSRLLAATLDIGADAQRRLQQGTLVEVEVADDEVAEATEDEDDDSESNSQSQKITRSLRQLSLKRVADFFESSAPFDFSRFIPGIFDHLISPRLSVLDRENTQAPSALLELFRVWSIDMDYVRYLVDHNPSVLPRVFDCLNATNVKPAVISRIFDIVESIIGLSEIKASIVEDVLAPIMGSLLSNLVALAQRSTGEAALTPQLTQRQLEILSRIAKYARDEVQATTLLSLLLPLLSKTHKVVNDGTKTNILAVVYELLPLISGLRDSASSIYVQTYRALCQLFQSLRARQGRITLLAAFQRLSEINPASAHISSMLAGLNAYSKKRLDEPDFDQRLTTFADLNGELHSTLSPDGWLPLLYNMLYFIQDPNELAVRSSASTSLRRFVDRVAVEGGDYEVVFTRTLYPALKNGLRTKHEMVRAEILLVLAHAIKQCDKITSLQQMRGLLADGDEEANFFNNILHVQIHRRARALRRLADYSDQGHLRSSTITDIFAPLVANFITTTGDVDHHVITEAIASLGRLAKHLAWGGYYALVQQYMRASREKTEKEKEGSERVYVRTLVTILDSFHFPMGDQADEHGVNETEEPTAPIVSRVTQKVADAVTGRLLPSLLQHLENRHGAEENMRLPIAVGIIQIALHLPDPARQTQILRLVTVVCQVLRSKSQDTRDLVRDTLRRITALLGSSYLPLVLKELRAALLRGPQLHVLAFTVHNILAFATSSEQGSEPKDLDACVNDAVHVSAEVVFGESGKDVQSEDFKTNMKEVRGAPSKGLDTFAILAQHIHPTYISGLLQPLRSILQETSSHRTLNTVDDVLRRIAGGLNSNVYLQPEDLLPLCHTLISQNARFLQEAPTQRAKGKSGRVANVTVQLKRKVEEGSKQYASNAYRFITFGLDLFNTAFRRNRFDYQNARIIARLEPMPAVIGNTLYSDNAQVLTHALKAAVCITKCPVKSVDKSLPVYVRQMMAILEQSGNTESEVAQGALKAFATIIRDCPAAHIKEKDLVRLLEIITPDIEEIGRQASVFAMLRAIVSRKFVVPEIYDVMDKVAEIVVTNQSAQVQESCRAILLQFLLEYPQGKGRLTNQLTFLAKNLSYVHESGRKSVMELLGAVVSKFNATLLYQHTDLLFVALVMVLANDESSKCREMGASLLQSLLMRLDDERRRSILGYLRSWTGQRERLRLCSVSAQVYGLYLDAFHADAADQQTAILDSLKDLLALGRWDDDSEETTEDRWRISYQALVTAGKLTRDFPGTLTDHSGLPWNLIIEDLLYPHTWVRTAAARVVAQLFAVTPANGSEVSNDLSPLSSSDHRRIAELSCEQLKSDNLDETLSLQVVKNLFYLGKRFAAVPLPAVESTELGEGEIPEEAGDVVVDPAVDDMEEHSGAHPLPWLFSRLSYQLRSAHIARRSRSTARATWTHQPLSILRWFAAMVSHLSSQDCERFLVHLLTPVYHLVEDDTIKDSRMEELRTVAVELRDLIQTKVGSTHFADVYNRIRQGRLALQRERRAERVLMTATRPDATAKRKQHKSLNKKDSRKRKSAVFNEKRGKLSNKRSRRE